ncbi:MAG TPA: TIGR00282 family metallophosphoesterase [Vicinamibacterales bacterium]|nr:TIGR00282 family metallophosphoesterase [Vicinamibacterales bacterium]
MKLLFIGDIFARPGRDLVRTGLTALVRTHAVDCVIANCENAAGGAGVTRDIAIELFKTGIDVMTSGNHIWDKREALDFIGGEPRLVRPSNYPPGAPGAGSYVWTSPEGVLVGVINAMGRIFLPAIDDPFVAVTREIARVREAGATVIFVDFHAEATSEKLAMGWFLDGKVTAVVGTHTHVQTADERIFPGGTAYLTDVGMTGPHDGVIGMERSSVIARFTTGLPARFDAATGDPRLNAVLITADPVSGRATAIERLSVSAAELVTMQARLSETVVST